MSDFSDFSHLNKWEDAELKIQKSKNTLGLFISMSGFSLESLDYNSTVLKSLILMDGADLYAVLDDRISLIDLLFRKRRYASETGNIFYQ